MSAHQQVLTILFLLLAVQLLWAVIPLASAVFVEPVLEIHLVFVQIIVVGFCWLSWRQLMAHLPRRKSVKCLGTSAAHWRRVNESIGLFFDSRGNFLADNLSSWYSCSASSLAESGGGWVEIHVGLGHSVLNIADKHGIKLSVNRLGIRWALTLIQIKSFLPDSQLFRHDCWDSFIAFRVDFGLFGCRILIDNSWFHGLDPVLSISIVESSFFFSPFKSHDGYNRWHPPIFVHKLRKPTFFTMESNTIFRQIVR